MKNDILFAHAVTLASAFIANGDIRHDPLPEKPKRPSVDTDKKISFWDSFWFLPACNDCNRFHTFIALWS